MDLNSSQSVSRHLRSKHIAVAEIVRIGNELVDLHSTVLPNINLFLLELIVDRVNESKNSHFKDTRFHLGVWQLFTKVWHRLNEQEFKLKNSILRKLKLAEVLIGVFENAMSGIESGVLLVDSVVEVSILIQESGFLDFTLDEASNVLKASLALVKQLQDVDELKSKWLSATISIFQSALTNNAKASSKKHLTEFCGSVLVELVAVALANKHNNELLSLIDSLIRDSLFSDTAKTFLKLNVQLFVETCRDKDSVDYVYEKISREIADTTELQDIFIVLTDKCPQSRFNLLQNLCQCRKSLSYDFLKDLMRSELDSHHDDRYEVIYSVMDINKQIGYEFGADVSSQLAQTKDQELVYKVFSRLVDCFITAREFESFYELWLQMISSDVELFSSDKYVHLVSTSISSLSEFQLDHLLKLQILPVLTTGKGLSHAELSHLVSVIPMVHFATKTKDARKAKLLKKEFLPLVNLDIDRSKILKKDTNEFLAVFWKLRYLLLALFEDTDFEHGELVCENIVEDSLKDVKSGSIFVYYSVFRLREMWEFEIDAKLVSLFTKLIGKCSAETLRSCFNRWCVIFDIWFDQKQLHKLTSVLLAYDTTKPSVWLDVLSNHYIFELGNVMSSIISELTKLITGSKATEYLQLVKTIPLACYSRATKVLLLDTLLQIALQNGAESTELALTIIVQLLKYGPTSKSKIETDIDAIFQLQKLTQVFLVKEITQLVWSYHSSQTHEAIHKTWIDLMNKRLVKDLKKSKNKLLEPHHLVAGICLTSSDVKGLSPDLVQELQESIVELLDKAQSKTNIISWSLDTLFELNLIESDYIQSLNSSLRRLGAHVASGDEIRLFNLLCKITPPKLEDLLHFMALYILLVKPSDTELHQKINVGMKLYLSKIGLPLFLQGFEFLLKEFPVSESQYTALLALFINTCQVYHEPKVENRQLKHYIVMSVSTLASLKFNDLTQVQITLESLRFLLTEMSWAVSQYSFEEMISVLCKTASYTTVVLDSVSLFSTNTQIFSHVLLYHRHRLSGRHHVIVKYLSDLLESLFHSRQSRTQISTSSSCGKSYLRLLSNLCEQGNSHQTNSTLLTSASSTVKRQLRKFLPILLANYVYLQTKLYMEGDVRDEVILGVFVIFDTLTQQELVAVNSALDMAGKSYFKTLLEDYNKLGKWKDDV